MLTATLSCSKLFEINLLQREESAAKSNVGSKMLFILQGLRELTLPLLTDTETTCTGVDNKIEGQALRKGPQNIAIVKGRCGITWIKELNLFHISIYEPNSRASYERNKIL